jgi:transposase
VAVAERVKVRKITNDEGNRLLRIVRRSSGSVVTWRRAQMVLLSAQGMDVGQIAKVAFTSEDRVREVLHTFNDDGFDSLYPRYAGGRPPYDVLEQQAERRVRRQEAETKKAARNRQMEQLAVQALAAHIQGEFPELREYEARNRAAERLRASGPKPTSECRTGSTPTPPGKRRCRGRCPASKASARWPLAASGPSESGSVSRSPARASTSWARFSAGRRFGIRDRSVATSPAYPY